MMGDTYAKVSENAVAKWRLERARIMLRLASSLAVDRRSRARDARVRANAAVAVRPSQRKKVGTPRCRLGADASFRDATIASRDRVDARGRRRDARERQKLKRANERARARSTARRGRGRATR